MQLERGVTMTKSEINEVVISGMGKGYSHVIIYCDHFDYTYHWKYVEEQENIKEILENIESLGSPDMFTIEEIYNYHLDINKQLGEKRAYHIEPINRKDKVEEALEYATKMHKGQYRKDGTEYIRHLAKLNI